MLPLHSLSSLKSGQSVTNSDTWFWVSSEVQIEDARTVNVPKGLGPQHYQHRHQSSCLCLHLPCILHHPMHFLFHPGYHHHRFLLSFHPVSLHLLGTLSPLQDIPQLLQTCHQLGYQQQYQRLIQLPSQRRKHLLYVGRSFTESDRDLNRSKYLAQWGCIVFQVCISIAYRTAATLKCIWHKQKWHHSVFSNILFHCRWWTCQTPTRQMSF